MKSRHLRIDFVSYEVTHNNVDTSTVKRKASGTDASRYTKMAELACKLAENDISRLIQEAKQIKSQQASKTRPCYNIKTQK